MIDSVDMVVYKNKILQIVECNALPTLVLMLQSEDPKVHYEAVRCLYDFTQSNVFIDCCLQSSKLLALAELALFVGWCDWKSGPLFAKY